MNPSVPWEEIKKQLHEEDPNLENAIKKIEPEYEIIKQKIIRQIKKDSKKILKNFLGIFFESFFI